MATKARNENGTILVSENDATAVLLISRLIESSYWRRVRIGFVQDRLGSQLKGVNVKRILSTYFKKSTIIRGAYEMPDKPFKFPKDFGLEMVSECPLPPEPHGYGQMSPRAQEKKLWCPPTHADKSHEARTRLEDGEES